MAMGSNLYLDYYFSDNCLVIELKESDNQGDFSISEIMIPLKDLKEKLDEN